MRFAIPAHSDERPPWLLRAGLLLYDRLASRNAPAGLGDRRSHPSSGRQRAEAAVRHRVRIFRLRGRRFAAGGPQCGRCRRTGGRDPHRRALRSRRPARHLAAGDDRSRPSPGDHREGAGQRHRRLDRLGCGNRVAHAAAALRCCQIEPDRRPAPVRYRQCLCVPEPRPAADFRQPLRARFHPDRHRGTCLQGRSSSRVDGGGRGRLSLRRRQPVFPRAGRTVRRDPDGLRRQRGDGFPQPRRAGRRR